MPNRVRDRGDRADGAQLAYAFDSQRVDLTVLFVNPADLDGWDVGMSGQVVLGKIIVGLVAKLRVHDSGFMQCRAEPHGLPWSEAGGGLEVAQRGGVSQCRSVGAAVPADDGLDVQAEVG